ncbi:MAG: 4-hydroxythreonine-4-phosphate dehydrogenase PdxA, partial [Phycisphaerae bacterium]|nr:4-hydroxythreonine-4-phosphate dehydrogenase PdxA [Phycisphaerae bacterium]
TVLDYDELPAPAAGKHEPTHYGGAASMAFLEDAIVAAQAGTIDAMVTAPISKEAWHLAGFKFPGHTELLAKRTKTKNFGMMFVAPQMKIILATIHEPLFSIVNRFTIGRVFNPIDLADKALREMFGIDNPHIAVCGLNPHAGEGGSIGDEEKRIIAPAILMASENGINVTGPYPADTLFRRAVRGEFDCVVAMYHDQALIPIKLLAWEDAVNLTVGLPIIRTSPGHGTAFDIAGKNRANPAPIKAAIQLAINLAKRRAAVK